MTTDWNAVRAQLQREEKEAHDLIKWIRGFVKNGGATSGHSRNSGEWWSVICRQPDAVLAEAFSNMSPDTLAAFFKACAGAASDAVDIAGSREYDRGWDEAKWQYEDCECDE